MERRPAMLDVVNFVSLSVPEVKIVGMVRYKGHGICCQLSPSNPSWEWGTDPAFLFREYFVGVDIKDLNGRMSDYLCVDPMIYRHPSSSLISSD